jgi:hypothetical protein
VAADARRKVISTFFGEEENPVLVYHVLLCCNMLGQAGPGDVLTAANALVEGETLKGLYNVES